MSKSKEGRFLTNETINNNQASTTILHTNQAKYVRIMGDMTSDLSNLSICGAVEGDSTTWVKIAPITKGDKHLDENAFNTNKFDLVGFIDHPPKFIRVGNISGTNATGVNLWYKLGY
tara:strand:+ start:265 stop:615 length:351 start_codon:yes stop_codon:yes gene_type:complete